MMLFKFGGLNMVKKEEDKLLEEDEEDPEMDSEDAEGDTLSDDEF